jgi:hypothetical protein
MVGSTGLPAGQLPAVERPAAVAVALLDHLAALREGHHAARRAIEQQVAGGRHAAQLARGADQPAGDGLARPAAAPLHAAHEIAAGQPGAEGHLGDLLAQRARHFARDARRLDGIVLIGVMQPDDDVDAAAGAADEGGIEAGRRLGRGPAQMVPGVGGGGRTPLAAGRRHAEHRGGPHLHLALDLDQGGHAVGRLAAIDGEALGDRHRPAGDVELLEQGDDVLLDRAEPDAELVGDLLVRLAEHQEMQDLGLPLR